MRLAKNAVESSNPQKENMSTFRWRPATAEDVPKLKAIYERQRKQLLARGLDPKHSTFELPDACSECVFQVAVGEMDGEVLGAIFFEAVVEAQMVSDDPRFMEAFMQEPDYFDQSLRLRGYQTVRAFVPRILGAGKRAVMKRIHFDSQDKNWRSFLKFL